VPDKRSRLPASAERLLLRLPEPARPHVRESLVRVGSIRTPKQAMQAFSDEVEHLLQVLMPVFVRNPRIRTPAAARRVAALGASAAAAVEQADELLALVSFGASVTPGTPTVLAVGVVATLVEAYAAASVRVHQLREHGYAVDPDAIARDVHAALFDAQERSKRGKALGDGLARRGATRLARRWAAGLVPVVGVAYAGRDATRTVDRVLRLPMPVTARVPDAARLAGPDEAGTPD
jgi:hypothetical protein